MVSRNCAEATAAADCHASCGYGALRRLVLGSFTAALLLALHGCEEPPPESPAAETVTAQRSAEAGVRPMSEETRDEISSPPLSSIQFQSMELAEAESLVYHSGRAAGEFAILESLGGGVGMVDIDADGWIDLLLPLGGGFRDGVPHGRGLAVLRNQHGLLRRTAAPALPAAPPFYGHGISATDVNQDGFTDVLVTGYGGLQLYLNHGDGTFIDATPLSGLSDRGWCTSAAWGDFNGDAHPDVYVAHYVNWSPDRHPRCFARDGKQRDVCSPREFEAQADQIWLSNGDGTYRPGDGGFVALDGGKGLAVLAADLDEDGDTDVYVSNDTVPNHVYLNEETAALRDVSARSGASVSDRGTPDGSMSIDAGDYNRDGRADLWVSNYERESFALYRNQGDAFFRHVSDVVGIQAAGGSFVGWGAVFADFDIDGDEDVLVANGHVVYHSEYAPLQQPMLLFENQDGDWFRNVAGDLPILAQPRSCRGLALGDLNRDGLPDAVASIVDGAPLVLVNSSRRGAGSIGIRLIGTRASRHPVGASITSRIDDRIVLRLQKSGGSFASTSAPVLHCAPENTGRVSLEIRWPGSAQTVAVMISPAAEHAVVETPAGPPRVYELPD